MNTGHARPVKTILACGSRNWRNREAVRIALLREPNLQWGWNHGPIRVVVGDCRGADTLAARAARDLGYETEVFEADWAEHGKAAGPIRNLRMLAGDPDLVIAFGRGRGTDHTCAEAKKRGIPVLRIADDTETLP